MILDSHGGSNENGGLQITQVRTCHTHSSSSPSARQLPMSSLMTTAQAVEFPCVEKSRCHLTEKDNGQRIFLKKLPKMKGAIEDSFQMDFTKNRNRHTEWYVQLGTHTTADGVTMRSATFQHVVTGLYLHVTEDGSVGTQNFKSDEIVILMEPIHQNTSQSQLESHKRWTANGSNRSGSTTGSSPTGGSNNNNPTNAQQLPETTSIQYFLIPKFMGNHKLAASRKREDHHGWEALISSGDEGASWELEFTSGELCFISNPVIHSQIRCDLFGKLTLSSVSKGWEVFRFIEVGHGHVAISSWTHTHKFLSSNPDGQVFTSENRLGHWEKWRLEKSEEGVYIISVAHPGRYLTIGLEEKEPLMTSTKPNDFSIWHFEPAHENTYYLSSLALDGRLQISSRRKGPFLSKHRRHWEEWRMERNEDGDVTLLSKAHEKYLGCNSRGDLHTTSTSGDWSLWLMEESPHGGVYLKSKVHQRALSVQQGQLCTTEETFTEAESFHLQPRLPATISGPRLAALGAAGVLGIALTMTMPYAVLGAMEVGGMAATELFLAGISAEALAGAGGGALLGAGVVSKTAATVKNETDERTFSPTVEAKEDYLIGSQRPLSAWRHW